MLVVPSRVRYGIRALVQLALSPADNIVTVSSVAEKENISKKYLESIFTLLKRGGIITSIRGPEGGYRLARATEAITLYEIIEAIEGPIVSVACLKDVSACERLKACPTRKLWEEYQVYLEDFFKAKTLKMIVSEAYKILEPTYK
ncbi:MAG: Rrf2 family transcriptional regulator [Spirochaetota bacterium]